MKIITKKRGFPCSIEWFAGDLIPYLRNENKYKFDKLCKDKVLETTGIMAEVLSVHDLNRTNFHPYRIYARCVDLPHKLCVKSVGSNPMLDYHTTDIVGIEWHDGHVRVFERVQTKHHMASPLHYGEISKTMPGLMRLLDDHKVSAVDIGEITRLIGNNYVFMCASKASQPTNKSIELLQSAIDKYTSLKNVLKITTRKFDWDKTFASMEKLPRAKFIAAYSNEPVYRSMKNVTRKQINFKVTELIRHLLFVEQQLNIADDTTFLEIEKQSILLDLATGIGKTRIGFQAIKYAANWYHNQTEKYMPSIYFTGSLNVNQYVDEALKEGYVRDDIQVVESKKTIIDLTKKIIIMSTTKANIAQFEDMPKNTFLLSIIDEAHKMHTAGFTSGTGIDNANIWRNQVIAIMRKTCMYSVLMTGTPVHKQIDKVRMLGVSLYEAAQAGLAQMPDVSVLDVSSDTDTRHAQYLQLVRDHTEYIVNANSLMHLNSIDHAERFCKQLDKYNIPVFRYFGTSLQNCKDRSELLPSYTNRGIVVCVGSMDGNVTIPGIAAFFAVDRMDPFTVQDYQRKLRLSRPDTPGSTIYLSKYTDESYCAHIIPALVALIKRTGMPSNDLHVTMFNHDIDNIQPLDAIVANNVVANNVADISKSSSKNPVVTDLPLAVNGTIDMSMLTSTKSFTDCLAHFATIMNKSDDELKQEKQQKLKRRHDDIQTEHQAQKKRKQDNKTQQLSDLEKLELCAKDNEMPRRTKSAPPEERNLATKWKNIRSGLSASNYMLIMAENSKYQCLKILLKQHDDKPKRGTDTPDGDFEIDILDLEEDLGDEVVSSAAYKAHSDLNDGQRVRALLGYICNNENAYPKRTHTEYGRYATDLKNNSNNCKADRIYINAFKKYLPKSVRTALQMDRWNDDGTLLKEPKK